MIKAIVFDMDGVIVDSEKLHFQAWKILFKQEKGIEIDEKYFKKMVGTTDLFTVRHFFRKYKIRGNIQEWRMKKKRIILKMFREKGKIFPGVKHIIRKLSAKYKMGLATGAWRASANVVMKKFDLKQYISKMVTKEDVRNHKPHPQAYQKMANLLGVDEKECVVFEDSVPGILAAKRAKCKCIAVTNSHPAAKLKKADLVVKDLRDKRIGKFISSL